LEFKRKDQGTQKQAMVLFAHFSLIRFQIFTLFMMLGHTQQAYRYFLLMLV